MIRVERADPGEQLVMLGMGWIGQNRQGLFIAMYATAIFGWAGPLAGHAARQSRQFEGLDMDVLQGEAVNPAVAEIVFVAYPVFTVHQQMIDRYIEVIDENALRLLPQVDIQRIRIAIETQTLGPETHHELIEMGVVPAHRKLDHPMQIGKSEIEGGDSQLGFQGVGGRIGNGIFRDLIQERATDGEKFFSRHLRLLALLLGIGHELGMVSR